MLYSAFWTTVLLFAFRLSNFFKLNVEDDIERVGLDFYYHGDVAYHHLETLNTDELDAATATLQAVRQNTTDTDTAHADDYVIYDSDTGSTYSKSFLNVQSGHNSERERMSSFEATEEALLLSVDEVNDRRASTRSRPMVLVRQDTILSVPEDVRRNLDAKKTGGIRL